MALQMKLELIFPAVEFIFPGQSACHDRAAPCDAVSQMSSDLQAALQSLPHGSSFRFLDELKSLLPGSDATAIYQVKGGEGFLEGHFPGNPMMPGVILIEAIAQLGGVVAQTDPDIPAMTDLRLTGIRAAKILGAAVPGDVLEIRAKVEGRLGGLVQIEGDVKGPEGILASAKVTLSGTLG
jgi:3-hydroxyacyl-[acyl-carrier-protein] dehydratase